MGLAVDPTREAADDGHARRGKLTPEHARHLGAVWRTGTRADDCNRRTRQQLRVSFTSEVKPGRRIVDRPQQRRQVTLA
jgi:hypothetical protein